MDMLHIPEWYIAYTRPSREKKVAYLFSQKNIKHYCPTRRIKPLYSGGPKTIYEPLFTSYVFVHITPGEYSLIKQIREVISLVHWLGKPVVIRNEEIDMIKKFMNFYNDVTLEKIPVCPNRMPIITRGPVIEEEDRKVTGVMNSFVNLQLPSLGYVLKASGEFIGPSDKLFDNDQSLLAATEIRIQ